MSSWLDGARLRFPSKPKYLVWKLTSTDLTFYIIVLQVPIPAGQQITIPPGQFTWQPYPAAAGPIDRPPLSPYDMFILPGTVFDLKFQLNSPVVVENITRATMRLEFDQVGSAPPQISIWNRSTETWQRQPDRGWGLHELENPDNLFWSQGRNPRPDRAPAGSNWGFFEGTRFFACCQYRGILMEIIKIAHLTKKYNGRVAVDDLNMIVREGEIYGFVGPNGAGKTTTIRMLATLLEPDAGQIWVAGHSVREEPLAVRKMIGYMPDFFGVYNDMQVWEYLDFFAACYAIPEHKRTGMIDDLLELVELTHRKDDMLESLSRGMKQRLSLARTLIHDPKILILDEPASGLDPRARIEIRELLLELAGMGKTIFFSTHILADVAEVCTQVGIIEAGKLVADGPLDRLAQGLAPQRSIQIDLLSHAPLAEEILARIPGVSRCSGQQPRNGWVWAQSYRVFIHG